MTALLRRTIAQLAACARYAGERRAEGQGLVEYALIISIIAIASLFVLGVLGNAIVTALSGIGQSIGDVT